MLVRNSVTENVNSWKVFLLFMSSVCKHITSEVGTKVGPDQPAPPVRVGSTRIVSDHEKNIKLNEIEIFTHLKVKIPVKSYPN